MLVTVKLKSNKKGEIDKFLKHFYNTNLNIPMEYVWQKDYKNPIELSDIIGAYIDNIDSYNLTMWISLDQNVYILINDSNANDLIKYLFERYPY